MKTYKKALVFIFHILLFATLWNQPLRAETVQVKGMWYFGLSAATSDETFSRDFKHIAETGFNTVFFAAVVEQDNAASLKVRPPAPELLAAFRRAAAAAKSAGLKTTMTAFLIVKDGAWRGTIMPMPRKKWATSYSDAIAPYAALAQESSIGMFCIGTEMETLKYDAETWLVVSAAVREKYKGPLGYNLNWWGNANTVNEIISKADWLKSLDYIGISGYFEISPSTDATRQKMAEGWTANRSFGPSIREQIIKLKKSFGKPLYLWEIGYRSMDGNAMHPWNWGADAAADEAEQADAFAAFLDVFGDGAVTDGFAVWASDPGLIKNEKGYDIFGKTAENIFRLFFTNAKIE